MSDRARLGPAHRPRHDVSLAGTYPRQGSERDVHQFSSSVRPSLVGNGGPEKPGEDSRDHRDSPPQ
jgi:hypothetical protein